MSMKAVAAAMMLAASLTVAPAAAHADSAPTVDEVVAVMAKLTDPGIPAVNKSDIVTPGLAPDEAGTADNHLNSLNGRGYIPFNFVATLFVPQTSSTPDAPHPLIAGLLRAAANNSD
jgi:hypothetical protein